MMKIEKMSFANVQKLTRKEMRSVMAGSGGGGSGSCVSHSGCPSGCAVTYNGQTGSCSSCCYA
ncbi:MAG: hypothetical protein EOO44_16895 [Flavobacterium sp.]|nr:MAG: hypothetical protein EOO44_16895 [Flavobacterium sp.]